jgi:hypothetical protein
MGNYTFPSRKRVDEVVQPHKAQQVGLELKVRSCSDSETAPRGEADTKWLEYLS